MVLLKKKKKAIAPVVSGELPEGRELELIHSIRLACDKEIKALNDPTDDVVGDLRICRFLRSKDGDVEAAKELYREFLQWRVADDHKVERIRQKVVGKTPKEFLEWFYPRITPDIPICPYAGENEDGDVIMMIRQGQADFHGMAKKLPDVDTFNAMLEWQLWYLDKLSREQERIAYLIKILDFGGLGDDGRGSPLWVSEVRGWLPQNMKGMSKRYPDHDAAFVLLNTPFMFKALFSIISIALTERQKKKFHVVGSSDDEEVRELLAKLVKEKDLPIPYGGDRRELLHLFPPRTAEVREELRHKVITWRDPDPRTNFQPEHAEPDDFDENVENDEVKDENRIEKSEERKGESQPKEKSFRSSLNDACAGIDNFTLEN